MPWSARIGFAVENSTDMMSPDFQRDARFVFIYFNRFHEIEANGGIKNRLELMVENLYGLPGYWFADANSPVMDLEQFLRDVLLRHV